MTLSDRVAHLKRLYWWNTGNEAEALYVPRAMLRDFAEALSSEVEGIGPKHHIYHWLSTGERTLTVFGLDVRVGGDSSELGVGRPV